MNIPAKAFDWDERTSAVADALTHNQPMFRQLFERSTDAMLLVNPHQQIILDCNQAAVEMMRASSKQQLLLMNPADLSPEFQPDGRRSHERTYEDAMLAISQGHHRFEWIARRMDGTDIPMEVVLTRIQNGEETLVAAVCRDITERKRAERELLELAKTLERRVEERTDALETTEAQLRALVEHAPEAIVVFNGEDGQFLYGNQHACALYGVPMEKLATLTPADVSPEFQPDGRRSDELAREKMDEALSGGTPVFEWLHKRPDGQIVPTEVRLLRLPAECDNLIRASIIDNTERKRAERELRESEQKYRALFEGASQGVVLHDETQILEVNSAAVQILGRRFAHEIVGRHPGEFSPAFQPNGMTSDALARKYIHECLTKGSARFDWLASGPDGREIPMEVMLTRIEWSGRQVIQAFITDITERQRAQAALAESEARFSAAFAGSPILIVIARVSDQKYVLVNDAFVKWSGYSREELVGRDSTEFNIWESLEDRKEAWADVHRFGFAREREYRFRNRHGVVSTMLLSFEIIQINNAPHMLAMGLDISARKRAEAELRASEAQLRESEARFSAAFQACPIFIGILRTSDGKFVLANDALVNWLGCPREEALGQTCADLGMWENLADRASVWEEVGAVGRIRQKECRWRNRRGELFTVLLSADTITLDHAPHVLLLALDITQRKQAEVEILKTLAREKELSQLKSNFVSMVSHEFRTPLGIIQSSAELLREFHQKMLPDERAEQLDSITRNTRRMAGMMEGVLVLSRLDAGKLDFNPAPLDLNLFCRRVVDEVLSATNRRCTIELTVNPVPFEAQADEQLLGHIFTNVLSNAVKYSEPGATVRFVLHRDGQDAVCLVCDRGIGIPTEDQQQLFKAFNRGSNVGTRPGTGLGLLLVKRCSELHGGAVRVESKLGEGTTVTVRLPVFPKA